MMIRIASRMLLVFCTLSASLLGAAEPFPAVGDQAADFELKSVTGQQVSLHDLLKKGPVALIVLRGFPGYQCPVCSKQVGSLLAQAEDFKQAGAQVVFIYPGPSQGLAARAREFINDKTIPDHFQLLVDPDFALTNKYRLRWDAPKETAYPSSFVIGRDQKISFAKISKTHGGRTTSEEILNAVRQVK